MTKIHVHYSMVIYTQNKIHEVRSIANLNRSYIDPTDCRPTVSDANRLIVGRQSADLACNFSCFLESAGCKKIITEHFFSFCRLCLGFGKCLESADRLPTIADYQLTVG